MGMAKKKKNEFRQDKPYSGFFSKLYLTEKQRRGLLHWGLYAAVLVALSVLQDVLLSRLRVFGATTDLVPCAIFLISVLEGAEGGSVFSLVASMLYLFSGTAPGPYCMVFITALSAFATIFRQGFLQKGFLAALLCVGAALLVYELAVFGIGLFLGLTTAQRLWGFLITTGMTLATVPALYALMMAIGNVGGEAWKE